MVMAASDNQLISSVVSNVVDVLYYSEDFTTAYARQLSSILLVDSSIAFSPISADKVWRLESKLGSELRILPLVLFLSLTELFW
jgi:hypothetical protein